MPKGGDGQINTAGNGQGFLNGQVPNPNNPPVCRTRFQRLCITLGIPPTTQVASSRWHLSGYDANIAFHNADAYVWVDRPWLPGAAQFDLTDESAQPFARLENRSWHTIGEI